MGDERRAFSLVPQGFSKNNHLRISIMGKTPYLWDILMHSDRPDSDSRVNQYWGHALTGKKAVRKV